MQVKILGSAAGGGFPQWNCACPNCHSLRSGSFQGKARTQTQVAVSSGRGSDDGTQWFLLGACPDLRAQIEATPDLQPRKGKRESPIAGVVLANADLDHVLGLLLLREMQPFRIYTMPSIRAVLREDNTVFLMLQRSKNQTVWCDVTPGTIFPLTTPGGAEDLHCRAMSVGERFPAYVPVERRNKLPSSDASVGLFVESPSGKRLAFLPAVPAVDEALLQALDAADLLLFDGTFWSDDELIRVVGSGQTARQMGHIPVSSPEGSLRCLAGLRRPRKIYIHINNTNPILNEASPEYHQVREAGWEIAEDGWQFDL
jgi:pyrroloquinoline quinone biosynthesis protein B